MKRLGLLIISLTMLTAGTGQSSNTSGSSVKELQDTTQKLISEIQVELDLIKHHQIKDSMFVVDSGK